MKASTLIYITIVIINVSNTDPLCLLGCNPNPSVDLHLYSIVLSYPIHIIAMMLIAFICE